MILSAQNPLLKEVRRLRASRRAREEAGRFVVEGIQAVVAAVEAGATLHALLYAPERLRSVVAERAIATARARGVRCEAVAAPLFEAMSERDNPAGILAVAERRLAGLEALRVEPGSLFVALYGVADPGNLGTVLRTVDAAGGDGVLLVGSTVDPFHPTVVKASAGTFFAVPLAEVADLTTLERWCAVSGITLVATSDKAEADLWTHPFPAPLLLLMGSEAHGLPDDWLARLPLATRVPMYGVADSLNLAVATALLLYEVRRQWNMKGGA